MDPPAVVSLPSTAEAPALARRHVEQVGASWPPALLDNALLVVTEAVTNAVRYGRGRVHLLVATSDHRVQIEVSDANPEPPRYRAPPPDGFSESGRGLYLVAALTSEWGTRERHDPPGKTVWMFLARS
jgi:anti-sigma regulatory factor (Ser/Thr protein kinase)